MKRNNFYCNIHIMVQKKSRKFNKQKLTIKLVIKNTKEMCPTITILETWTKLSDFELYLLFTWEIQFIYIIHITFYHMSGCCMNNLHHTYNVVVDVLKY